MLRFRLPFEVPLRLLGLMISPSRAGVIFISLPSLLLPWIWNCVLNSHIWWERKYYVWREKSELSGIVAVHYYRSQLHRVVAKANYLGGQSKILRGKIFEVKWDKIDLVSPFRSIGKFFWEGGGANDVATLPPDTPLPWLRACSCSFEVTTSSSGYLLLR